MPDEQITIESIETKSDCKNCFALCCASLPYAESADFAFNKNGGEPCRNLQDDYRCKIHKNLRINGFKGCTVYECFGAGQKVSQNIFQGRSWREDPAKAEEMFKVFPIVQQLHEMLHYLKEALELKEAQSIHSDIREAIISTKRLTLMGTEEILKIYVPAHRKMISRILSQASESVRAGVKKEARFNKRKIKRGVDLIEAKLRGARLPGFCFKGALLIAADLRESDLRKCDFLGADLRDADLSGADLTDSFFLTQAQVNSAAGNADTRLPASLIHPRHWL